MQQGPLQIGFILEDFSADSPAQHLLDRFLIGYPRDGEFHRPECQVHVWLASGATDSELTRRLTDFPLRRHQTIESVVAAANRIIVVPRQIASPDLLQAIVRSAAASSCIFVHGALAETRREAATLAAQAAGKNVRLVAGTSIRATWRLPAVEFPRGRKLTDALVVVQGEFPLSELHAIDVLPLNPGVDAVDAEYFEGKAVWKLLEGPVRPLLAAALSRSDSPQGDPVRDGRTQDVLGLGLVQKLATRPRGWQIRFTDGLCGTILVLDGVVADYNYADRDAEGRIISTQIFRPPAPQRHEYSRLATVIEGFFQSQRHPWPTEQCIVSSALMEEFAKARTVEKAAE